MQFLSYSFLLVLLALCLTCHSIYLPLYLSPKQSFYYAVVSVGSQNLNVTVDTGSPATWLIRPDTKCAKGIMESAASCSEEFGDPWVPGVACSLAQNQSNTAVAVYAGLRVVNGVSCHSDWQLAGRVISNQYFISAMYTEISDQKPASGLLGLSYGYPTPWNGGNGFRPSLTKTRRDKSDLSATVVYLRKSRKWLRTRKLWPVDASDSPILDHIFNDLVDIPPYFSFSLARYCPFPKHPVSSFLHIGGSIDASHPSVNASAKNSIYLPLQKTRDRQGERGFNGYVIAVTNILIYPAGTSPDALPNTLTPFAFDEATYLYQLDTGSALNALPLIYTTYINSLYQPPAQYNGASWIVDCSAIPPRFGINVHTPGDNSTYPSYYTGQNFYMNAEDMIWQDPVSGTCFSAFQNPTYGYSANYPPVSDFDPIGLLGQAFLKNVYVEIYRGNTSGQAADSIYLAGREYYEV